MVNCRDIAHKLCCTCFLTLSFSHTHTGLDIINNVTQIKSRCVCVHGWAAGVWLCVFCAHAEIKTGWINFGNCKRRQKLTWMFVCLWKSQSKIVTFANWIHLSKFTAGVKNIWCVRIIIYICTTKQKRTKMKCATFKLLAVWLERKYTGSPIWSKFLKIISQKLVMYGCVY